MPVPRPHPGNHPTCRAAVRAVACLSALFALSLCTPTARAQYRFDHWTADNGLPQNSVRDIVQTRDGYLWFTTFDGLVRFDGVRFTVFNKSNSPDLPSNRFVELYEDRAGDLWATLETRQVVRLHQGRFTVYTQAQGLPDAPIFSFTLSGDEQGNVLIVDPNYSLATAAFGNYSFQVYRWSEGRFQPAGLLNYSYSGPSLMRDEVMSTINVKFFEGDHWFSTNQRLVRNLNGGGTQIYDEAKGVTGTRMGLIWGKGKPMQAVSRDAAGRLWLTELKSGHTQLMSLQTSEGLGDIYCAYADNEGNYWFGTFNNGLFRARRQAITPYGKAQGLNVTEVYPLLESRDGSLWIGTGTEGVFRFKDGVFTRYTDPEVITFGSSLYEDRTGQLWVNGRSRLENGKFVRAPWADELAYLFGWTMWEDRDGAYWIGVSNGVLRYQNGVVTQFATNDGLAGQDTKVIIEDVQGGLWLGSYGGLTHYKDGKFTVWTEKDGLPGDTVRALKQDPDGTLWIGTYDSGLGRFKDGRFTRYTSKDGLFDNGVFQILEDEFGWFWLSCNRGIYRVRKQELLDFADGRIKSVNSLAYNKSDGMPSSECNGGRWPAGIKTRDGKLWFPTMEGMAMIDPAVVKANTQPPPVVIEGMRVNNEPVPFDAWDSAIHGLQSAIRVLPGQDNFEIEYTALSFINSEIMRFKYKLEGADQDWVDAGTRRTAYYSHVEPGDYTFRVIAANADGVWNEAGASLQITVVPPFWRTWWFQTTVALVGVALVGFAWTYRVRQLRRVQAAQLAFARQLIASQEGERKRIAGELHDSLGQNLLIVKNWALVGLNTLAADNPGREHLTEISETTSLALEEVRQIAHNLRPYQLERLGLTNTLEYMMRQVENSSDIAFTVELETIDGLLPPESEISLYRIVQEIINNVIKHSDATEAWLTVRRAAGGAQIICRDNGKGFDPAAAAKSRQSGMGLSGLAERVRILGGHYTIESAPGAGATVTITVNTSQK